MGHHLGTKDSLVPLIDRLNKYPIGLVDTEKLREILGLLFDEREAFVASRFPLEESTLVELTRSTGMDAAELLPVLETMADKGLVMDMPYADTTYYLLMPGLIGFFEFTFMKHRTDLPVAHLATLMREYLEESQGTEFFGSKTQLTRTLAYEEHIPVTSEIATYEQAIHKLIRPLPHELLTGAAFEMLISPIHSLVATGHRATASGWVHRPWRMGRKTSSRDTSSRTCSRCSRGSSSAAG